MPEEFARRGISAGTASNAAGQSIVYVLGGRYQQQPSDPAATSILAYNVSTDAWTTKAARFTGAGTNGVGKIGSRLYISGGMQPSVEPGLWTEVTSGLYVYDLVGDRITRKANMPVPTMGGVTGVISGKLYVLAGACLSGGVMVFTCRNFYRYDPATNRWTTLPSAPSNHLNGAGVVLDGKFHVAGGGSSPHRSFDVYDPVTNSWKTLGLMPPRRDIAVGATVGGKIVVIGVYGQDRNTVAYNPTTSSWRNRAPFPSVEEGFLKYPEVAIRVLRDGRAHILSMTGGIIFPDGHVIPAATYVYTP